MFFKKKKISGAIDLNNIGAVETEKNLANDTKKDEPPNVSFIKLYRYASTRDKIYIFLALLFSIIAGLSLPLISLILGYLMQSMVDYGQSITAGTPNKDEFLEANLNFAIYSCSIGLVVIILSYAATAMMNIAAYNQVYRIRQEYLKAALNQDFEYFDTHQTGDIASKINDDVVKLEEGIGEKLATFVFYQAGFISCIVMALIKGWKLALLCLVSLPVTLTLVGAAGWISARLSKQEAIVLGRAGSIAEEVLSVIRTIYAFNGQKNELKRYQNELRQIRKINIKKGLFNGLAMGLLYICMFGAYALSLWLGYRFTVQDPENYDIFTMIAVFFGIMMASEHFGMSTTLMEVFGVATGAGAQIFHLIDNVPRINPSLNRGVTPTSIDGNIELKNVIFTYPSRPDVPILNNVNLSVKKGQSVALVGHSGCGKSTIIQLISRFYDVIDGNVRIDGNDVRELSVRWLRSQIGLVGQEPVLFNASVRDNIRFGREDASNMDIETVAKQANAHDFIMKLPKGYETLVGERGATLSGGQKQRIAIARALVRNPRILLLDEATSALDTSSEAIVQKALDKAQEGRTTIVVAHRLSTIRNVDVIYVFKSGQVVESGTHEELMQKKEHYYDMVMIQRGNDENKEDPTKLIRGISVTSEKVDEEEIEIHSQVNNEIVEKQQEISFRRVVQLNSPEWKSITLASLASIITGFALPILGVVLGDFVGALSNPDGNYVLSQVNRYALIFVGAGLFSGATQFIKVFMYGVAGEYLTERLRSLMFENMLEQEVSFYDDKNNSTGALCARLSGEAAAVQGATGQRIGTVLQAIGTFIFSLALSMIFEWRVGLVALLFVPILGGILYKEGRMAHSDTFGTAKTMESSSKIAVEAVANVRTVASLGNEDAFLKKYAIGLFPALVIAKKSAHWRGFVFGLSRGLFNFVYAAALYYGGTLVVYHGVDYATVFKSAEALFMGVASAAEAFAFAPNFHKGINAAERIIILLSKKSKIVDPSKPTVENFVGTGKASLTDIKFKYPTRPTIQVLKNFNLKIEKGKTIALVGASGCGKSTIIQLLERYYDPDNGKVAQDDISLPELRLADVRQSIGFVQQEPILLDRSIGENIAYGDNSRVVTMEEIINVANQANIHSFITSLPAGYETNVGSKGTQLSGGQKQRIAIARALLRKPKILLLDEATSALDTESEKVVQDALDAAKAGRTCVMIAHRLSTVRDADRICVLSEGRVAEAGTHKQLMEHKGLYYKLNSRGYM